MLVLKISNQFKKDIKLLKKQNRDLKKLENMMNEKELVLVRTGSHSELFV